MGARTSWSRVRVERGIYLLPNGKYAVCCRRAGRLWYLTVGPDLALARSERLALVTAAEAGAAPVSPRLRFDTVAGWWLERFEAKVAAGERHPRTLEAHRYHLDRHLLPALGGRRIASITVDDVAELLHRLRGKGCSAKTSASALARRSPGCRRHRSASRAGGRRAVEDPTSAAKTAARNYWYLVPRQALTPCATAWIEACPCRFFSSSCVPAGLRSKTTCLRVPVNAYGALSS